MILKPAAMSYDLVTRSISAFGKEVPPRTHGVLDCTLLPIARLPHWCFTARKARSGMSSACRMVAGRVLDAADGDGWSYPIAASPGASHGASAGGNWWQAVADGSIEG